MRLVLHLDGMADKAMTKVLNAVTKAQGANAAEALEAHLDLAKEKAKSRALREELDSQKKEMKKSSKAEVATAIVTAPLGTAVGYLAGDWAHDQVVSRLGKENMATPYVVPVVGGAIAYGGYTAKGMAIDEKAAVTGFGVGMAAAGLKRSYTDFWSKP